MMISTRTLILILSYFQDLTAQDVRTLLSRRGVSVLLIDPGDFPARIALDASFSTEHWQGSFFYDGTRYHLCDIRSILYRRPTHYQVDMALPPQVQAFAEQEASKGFGGILRSLDCFWVSRLEALREAGFKPRQLQAASRLGLRVPRTLITNDPEAVQRFYEECSGQVVYKTLHGGNIGVSDDSWDAIYTSLVTPESLKRLAQVRYTAHLFQQRIEKTYEVRVTIVGTSVFAAAIYSQHSEAAHLDFRAAYGDLHYEAMQLPPEIEYACVKLVQDFGLTYSAIDMAVTPDGEYCFFELNPAGQYQWIEHATGMPITETLGDLLIRGGVEA